jgi:hypothetical protein
VGDGGALPVAGAVTVVGGVCTGEVGGDAEVGVITKTVVVGTGPDVVGGGEYVVDAVVTRMPVDVRNVVVSTDAVVERSSLRVGSGSPAQAANNPLRVIAHPIEGMIRRIRGIIDRPTCRT